MQNSYERILALAGQIKPRPSLSTVRHTIPLNKNWMFAQVKGDAEETKLRHTATFPTDVYSDLLFHGLIPDPFHGKNEEEIQWVAQKSWKYQTTFQTPSGVLSVARAVLVFEGLDTFATVTLNGVEILQTNNMFITHEVEVKGLLRKGYLENDLKIYFADPVPRAEAVMKEYSNHKWGTMGGDPKRTAVRKAQYHFGWDWGPRLITCGPWKPIYLELYDTRITDLSYNTALDHNLEHAKVEVNMEVDGLVDNATFELFFEEQPVAQVEVSANENAKIISAKLNVSLAKLWWPFTHGSQNLYTLTSSIFHNGLQVDRRSCRVGIRKVELVQQPLDGQDGTSFFFRINDVPLFSSGSCWIPADSFTTRISPQKYRDWIELAKSGNQSMIRVWGGGIFEHEAFYEACDELGVLVWQDFMFACGNYPTHTTMLESIKVEAEQNVKRLRNHPSIVIWAGNNEDYLWVLLGGLEYDADDKDPESWLKSTFPARYIYEHLLPKICSELIPQIPYHPGSPFGGEVAIDSTIGDIHQWGVWHLDQAPYQDFPYMGGRFVSEFGMQAFPTRETVNQYFIDSSEGCSTTDEIVRWHNKSDGAEDRLKKYVTGNLPVYDEIDIDSQIYHTQLIQAEADGTAFRSWRREWRGLGKEYCSGALVWQLNDCWPGTSWAVADFYLRPKMAFWAIKRESAPITVGIQRNGKSIDIWAVNMTLTAKRVNVLLRMWSVRSGKMLFETILYKGMDLQANQSTECGRIDLPSGELRGRDIVVAAYIIENGAQLAKHVNFHEPLKEVPFQRASGLSCKIGVDEQGKSFLELASDVPVKGLLVTAQANSGGDVKFDDNGVDLVPGEIARLGVHGLGMGDEKRLSLTWLGGSKSCSEN